MNFSFLSLIPMLSTAGSFLLSIIMWAIHHPVIFISSLTVFTWIYYLAMCSLKRAYDAKQIPKILLPIVYVLLIGFLVTDAIFNLVVGTIVFLQWPRQWLFTERCVENKDRWDWRRDMAQWWCRAMLNPFDPSGRHC